jgi:predicted nuclease with TOPRIM domain
MKVGTPEWERDDLLRQVSNHLCLDLNRVQEEIDRLEKEMRKLSERKTLILDDIIKIGRVRQELLSAE